MLFYKDIIKRLFDVILSLLALCCLIPLSLLIATLIKLDSDGPVFFSQKRMGRDFKPFEFYKFRSMIVDAHQKGLSITAGDDPRITKVGKFLRTTKIDELPQFFNVLKGDMSFVGPRPEVNKYVEMFYNDYKEILRIRPGITDLASIRYRDESIVLGKAKEPEKEYVERILPEKILLAREYINNISFIYDVALIFKTLIRLVNSGRRL